MTTIGILNEGPLHAGLKAFYRRVGDQVEVPLDGFVVDLMRDGTLIEIQTRGFSAMRRKFDHLLDGHPIRLVHPIAVRRWIVRLDAAGQQVSRRRSPKQGIAADVCAELVSFPSLLSHPHFTLEVALTEEEEVRRPTPEGRSRRRGFVVEERRLVGILDTLQIASPEDLLALLPTGLPDPFSTRDIARGLRRTRHQAQEIAYCLRVAGAAAIVGRDAHGIQYRLPSGRGDPMVTN